MVSKSHDERQSTSPGHLKTSPLGVLPNGRKQQQLTLSTICKWELGHLPLGPEPGSGHVIEAIGLSKSRTGEQNPESTDTRGLSRRE